MAEIYGNRAYLKYISYKPQVYARVCDENEELENKENNN